MQSRWPKRAVVWCSWSVTASARRPTPTWRGSPRRTRLATCWRPRRLPIRRVPAARVEYYSDLMSTAATAANAEAVAAARQVGGENAPSCTFAAAVVDRELVVAGWVGDSRVYWLGDDQTALQLSIDDSWVTDQVDHGMSRTQAEADPMAHSITRWLGADATDPTARVRIARRDGRGMGARVLGRPVELLLGRVRPRRPDHEVRQPRSDRAGRAPRRLGERAGRPRQHHRRARPRRARRPSGSTAADRRTDADAAGPQTRSS